MKGEVLEIKNKVKLREKLCIFAKSAEHFLCQKLNIQKKKDHNKSLQFSFTVTDIQESLEHNSYKQSL